MKGKIERVSVNTMSKLRRSVIKVNYGVLIDDSNSILNVNLFSIDTKVRGTVSFVDNAAWICCQVLEHYNIKEGIENIRWTYITMPVISPFYFYTHEGIPNKVEFINGEITKPYAYAVSIKQFQEGWGEATNIEHFDQLLKQGFSLSSTNFYSESLFKYFVYTPKHNVKFHTIDPSFDEIDFPVVFVNSEKFISHWRDQCHHSLKTKLLLKTWVLTGNYTFLDNDDAKLLSGGVEETLKHGVHSDMAGTVHIDYFNKIRFVNGRHRTVNLYNLGARYIPIQIEKEQLSVFENLFN